MIVVNSDSYDSYMNFVKGYWFDNKVVDCGSIECNTTHDYSIEEIKKIYVYNNEKLNNNYLNDNRNNTNESEPTLSNNRRTNPEYKKPTDHNNKVSERRGGGKIGTNRKYDRKTTNKNIIIQESINSNNNEREMQQMRTESRIQTNDRRRDVLLDSFSKRLIRSSIN